MQPLTWFKFYPSFITDPRIQRLPIPERYAVVSLMCLAATIPGSAPGSINLEDGDIAHTLQMEIPDWQTLKSKLVARGILEFLQDRLVGFPEWAIKQGKASNPKAKTGKSKKKKDNPKAVRDRMRRYRQRQKEAKNGANSQSAASGVTGTVTGVTGNVTGVTGTVTGTVTGVTGGRVNARNTVQQRVSTEPVTDDVTGTVTGVTDDVTGTVTPVTQIVSKATGSVVSSDFSQPPIEKIRGEEKREELITYTLDLEGVCAEDNTSIDNFSGEAEPELTGGKVTLIRAERSGSPGAIARFEERMGGGSIPAYRTNLGPNGIDPNFVKHIQRYLESCPSIERANPAMAKSWIVKREFTDQGTAQIQIQVESWLDSTQNPQQAVPQGKANQRLFEGYQATLEAVSVESSQDELDLIQQVAASMGG